MLQWRVAAHKIAFVYEEGIPIAAGSQKGYPPLVGGSSAVILLGRGLNGHLPGRASSGNDIENVSAARDIDYRAP